MFRKAFILVISTVLCLTFTVTACKPKNTIDNPKSSGSVSSSDSCDGSQEVSRSFTKSDDFDYSGTSPSLSGEKDEPASDAQTAYPSLYAMYKLGNLDGSYTGTDKNVGFPLRLKRNGDTFTTYPVGYGQNTTGGRGAESDDIYECATGLEILSALESIKAKQADNPDLKSIIKVTAEINQENTTAEGASSLVYQIVPTSINNLTVIGANSSAVFYGVGINFKSCNNVIVQNITVHHPSYKLKNEKDCLEFNQCNNVWVDHCELYNDSPVNSSEKDYYDGLVDVKNHSSGVTISYNYLHDAFKTSLVGSGPDDLWNSRTVTYHHNVFKNLNSRVPAIRSGYGHIYNNYYDTIIGSGANCRIEAQVYIENNVFVNAKKPICADEDAIKGFYNISSGNVFNNCSGVPSSNTTDFTPSYAYILDDADNLKAYLDKTVGVNKVDVLVQCANDSGYDNTYEIADNLLISRAIDELPAISLSNDCLQRLTYLSKEVLFSSSEEIAKVANLSKLISSVETYIDLYAIDLNARINAIDFNANFAFNALDYLQAKSEYDSAAELIKNKITAKSALDAQTSDYTQNFETYFNNQVDGLQNANSESMPSIEGLLQLYDRAKNSLKSKLKYTDLQNAYILSKAHIVADEFDALCNLLPDADSVTHADSANVLNAINAYNELTEKQFSLVSPESKSKFNAVYNKVATTVRSMDISANALGKVLDVSAKAGDINLSKNMEVISTNASFEGKNYERTAYISGYGNRGSKSLWFTVYSPCDITVILNTIDAGGKLVVGDTDGNVIGEYTTENANVTKITISDLPLGEYRFYTAMPSGNYTASKAYVYEFVITPKS